MIAVWNIVVLKPKFQIKLSNIKHYLGLLSNSVQVLYKMVGKVFVLAFKRVLAHLGVILFCDKFKEESEFFTPRVEQRK